MDSSSSWVRGRCIGKGAFGTVSFGVSKSDGRIFAVKSVDLKTGLPAQIEALENEIRILRSVSPSPYVVAFLGDDVTAPSYRNLHLEYLPGGTLADVDEQLVRFYTWCLVNGLKHVHSSGFVHCDVKGRNVLLGPNCSVAKLADFGSAVEVAAVASGDGGAILPRGSPLWMAPEVIRRESQGPESDVWSLGCTVIEMINGKPAWEDHGGDTLSRIGYSGELPEFPDRLSEIGKDFLEKCLRREPKERWSCDQLLQHPFLCSVTVPSSHSTLNYKLEDSSPRCVLDWLNTDFAADDEDEEDEIEGGGEISSAKGRIGKLASELRANWETEGWFTVRGLETNTEVTETETEEEGGGAIWEYGNCGGVKEGFMKVVGRKWEYSDKRGRANRGKWKMGGKWWLVWRCDDDHREECKLWSVIAGWSCHQYRSKNREIIRIYNNYSFFFYCKLFKFKLNILLFPLFIFHIPFLSQFSSTLSKAIYMLFCSWPFMFS